MVGTLSLASGISFGSSLSLGAGLSVGSSIFELLPDLSSLLPFCGLEGFAFLGLWVFGREGALSEATNACLLHHHCCESTELQTVNMREADELNPIALVSEIVYT